MGYSEGATTILRGFKVSVAVLDAFLAANGVHETYGTPNFYKDHPDNAPISKLLYNKIVGYAGAAGSDTDKNKFRVTMPRREGRTHSFVAYVTYAWLSVYAHRELRLEEDLPAEIPAGFEELRKEILSFAGPDKGIPESEKIGDDEGRMGLFAVYAHDLYGEYTPPWMVERYQAPQQCDQCDAVFTSPYVAWDQRQEHRIQVHGVRESRDPFPEG
ncbi:hypothetical protein QBC46DRAFT_395832 [Diplogelasinospora grovesii]|uniref:C2H2-type domain-containing protein n=1 Tax=Diplogelasinospora grovesii TaxID=303347 RepID=A0AAN6S0P8_9PEZI|nr:hypothetical protein QBC46DRAFT_395832 [Diplogelasinospora grovesii]